MEYTVSKLAKLSGMSARTLRYYDQIDLLKPNRINSSGYRIYGQVEVDLLQQILFYRELEMSLQQIKTILQADDFDINEALESHLVHLNRQRERLEGLISTVEKSLQAKEGGLKMSEEEKFKAFKQGKLDQNEEKYGTEIRKQYGEEAVNAANNKLNNVKKADWENHDALTNKLNEKLAEATKLADPTSELAKEVVALHKEWLIFSWPEGYYDVEKHIGLTEMYVKDPRFKEYYEKITPGAAEFLHQAIKATFNK